MCSTLGGQWGMDIDIVTSSKMRISVEPTLAMNARGDCEQKSKC